MGKRRHKKHEHEHIDESWLIPYADLLTLLLALFIVLFASSQVDVEKLQKFSQTFNVIFDGGDGVMEQPTVSEPIIPEEEVPLDDLTDEEKMAEVEKDQEELRELQERLQNYINENGLDSQFSTELKSEGLLITIRDQVLFPSGSATVRKEDEVIANELAKLLVMDPPREIVISGHTDNVPIRNAQFDSNWELSVIRAVSFMEILLNNASLDPTLFSAKGFGEFTPIADNESVEGRAQNRRVEVLVRPRVVE
ncbi:flagellar motor protein MotB [Mangrovibacillus cuniculi]|nr:flagellar motor protein MotB [Mangrovibacillus cuniculi]